MQTQESINLLGLQVEDKVTGYIGVVVTIAFDLYGCIQAIVRPRVDDKGQIRDSNWFDVDRLKVIDETPVMKLPDFVVTKGPEIKPLNN